MNIFTTTFNTITLASGSVHKLHYKLYSDIKCNNHIRFGYEHVLIATKVIRLILYYVLGKFQRYYLSDSYHKQYLSRTCKYDLFQYCTLISP